MIHRVTKYEPFIYYFSSEVDKCKLKRYIDERKSKLLDEFICDFFTSCYINKHDPHHHTLSDVPSLS